MVMKRLVLLVVLISVAAALVWILMSRPDHPESRQVPPTLPTAQQAVPLSVQAAKPAVHPPEPSPEEGGEEAITRPPEFGWGACVVYGTVTDVDGEPACDVRVAIVRTEDERGLSMAVKNMPVDETVALDDGSYRFAAVPDGTYRIYAIATDACGWGACNLKWESQHASGVEVDIQMNPTPETGGTVRNAEAEPVEGANVVVIGGPRHACIIAKLVPIATNENGRYAITFLWEGSHTVEIKAEGYAPAVLENVNAGTTDNDVVLYAGLSVSGRVTFGHSGRPAPGIPVIADNFEKGADIETVTDDEGMYLLDALSAKAVYTITVKSEEYVVTENPVVMPVDMEVPPEIDIEFTRISLEDGEHATDVDIVLSNGGSISGTVTVSETGEPLPGATISARGIPSSTPREAMSGENGTYTFSLLPAGLYIVECEPPEGFVEIVGDRVRTTKRVTVRPEEEVSGADFTFMRGASISGRVMDSDMNAIEGAELSATSAEQGEPRVRSDARSGAGGHYHLTGVLQGLRYRIWVRAKGYTGVLSEPVAVPFEEDAKDIDFVLEDGATISGRVVDTKGRSVSNARVELARQGEPQAVQGVELDDMPLPPPPVPTDAEGRFEIGEVWPGSYRFRIGAHDADHRYSQIAKNDPITVRGGEVITDLELIIAAADEGVIEGCARNEQGHGVADVRVGAETAGGGSGSTKTDGSGRYSIGGLGEAPVDLSFRHGSYADARLEDVPPGTMDADVVMLQKGGISGRVIDASTRRGLRDFDVRVERLEMHDGAEAPYTARGHFTKGRRAGAFVVENMFPGVAALRVSASGYATQDVTDIVVQSGRVAGGIEIFMSKEGVIEGRITRNGQPAFRYVGVTAFPSSEPDRTAGTGGVDGNGFYRIEKLQPDTYLVLAQIGKGYRKGSTIGTATVQVAAGQTVRVDFDLGGSVLLRGKVSAPGGHDVVAVIVRRSSATEPLYFEDWALIQREMLGWARCGPDGSYEVTDLPEGTYNVTVLGAPRWGSPAAETTQTSRTITVKDGEQRELNFSL
jgi:hypothetical protein